MKNKQLFENIKEEGLYLGVLFIVVVIIFKIIFFKENMMVVVRTVSSLFYIIVLPGYCVMMYWTDKIDFKERIVLGIAAGTVVVGFISYYLGVIGLNVKYHVVLLPLVVMVLSILLNIVFKK